ncbi:lamin tail domain-containing protein [Haloarculaceae archaeon H-GB1-1]|nr:lamin tail domain-containing protein [Haloarculaceae archaeon H-GB1-1]
MTRRRSFAIWTLVLLVVLAGCVSVSDAGVESSGEMQSPTAPASPSTATTEPPPNGTLDVHFINVGQSVSTLIVSPANETVLIDSGDFTDDGEHVLQYLQRHDVERIDHFVVSHADADHIGGNAAIIEYYETEANGIGAIYDPGIAASTQTYAEYLDAVERHNVTLYETRDGDSLPVAGVDVQVLGPPDPYIEGEQRNENSLVLRFAFGNTSFLFTGDAEDDQEAYLVDTYGERLRSTVLKAGHHGSASSTSGALLDAVQPGVVVVSSAYESRYGHPSEATLHRLSNRSIPTYWTGTHGNVVLTSDGEQVTIQTQRDAPTDPLAIRESAPIAPGTVDPVEPRATITGRDMSATTPVAMDGGTTTKSGESLAVATINADAAGHDGENLNDEYVVFENTGDHALSLGGWQVADEAGHQYTFPEGTTLASGASVTLHTGSGTDTETDRYWGSAQPIWNNGGDTVIVTNADGEVVRRVTYP